MTDRYDIDTDNPIGHGAYGHVYPCHISSLFHEYLKRHRVPVCTDAKQKLFAVKVQSYDALFWEQLSLLREVDVLMRTKNYPGTVEVYDYWFSAKSKQAFLVLQLADSSMQQYLQQQANPMMRLKVLPFVIAQLLLHVAYLQHNGIAHRDIKPQNILMQTAPEIFGWSLDDKHVYKQPNGSRAKEKPSLYGTHHSLENISLHTPPSVKPPIKQMCKFFLPMAHNCSCFNSVLEPNQMQFKKPKLVVHSKRQGNMRDDALRKRRSDQAGKTLSTKRRAASQSKSTNCTVANATRDFENLARATPIPMKQDCCFTSGDTSEHLRYSKDTKTPLAGSLPGRRLQESSEQSIHFDNNFPPTLSQQSSSDILQLSKSVPLVTLCDFGLSKHLNKTHHSPFIVTPNYRAPELFDPLAFSGVSQKASDCHVAEQTTVFDDEAESALRARLKSSLRLSNTASMTSTVSSDANDVSIKREEDLAYTENIDVWGLGCCFAQFASGRTLFPGRNLTTVFDSLQSLMMQCPSSSSDSASKEFTNAPQVDHSTACSGDGFCTVTSEDDDMFEDMFEDEAGTASLHADQPASSRRHNVSDQSNDACQWVESAALRAQRIRQRIFLHLLTKRSPHDTENVAQRVCDCLGDDFFDLLAQMLDPNPHTRPSAEELLSHDFVKPFVEPSAVLIYAVALQNFDDHAAFVSLRDNAVPPHQVFTKLPKRHSDHHWWSFQPGVRAGCFAKDQRRSLLLNVDWCDLLLNFRTTIFSWMFKVARQSNCRYQTLFSALYNFDRCIANFPLNNVSSTLCDFSNYKLLAVCCLYLVFRYYERIYVTIEALLSDLSLKVTDERHIEHAMALVLNAVGGQLTLPSPWHFSLLAFKNMHDNKLSDFADISTYRLFLNRIYHGHTPFCHENTVSGSASFNRRFVVRFRSAQQKQEMSQRQTVLLFNNNLMAQQLRRDTCQSSRIYSSEFKKKCSRLLFCVMQSHGEPYCQHNNRALGHLVFRRRLFNALFSLAFSKFQLRQQHSVGCCSKNCDQIHTTTLARSKCL